MNINNPILAPEKAVETPIIPSALNSHSPSLSLKVHEQGVGCLNNQLSMQAEEKEKNAFIASVKKTPFQLEKRVWNPKFLSITYAPLAETDSLIGKVSLYGSKEGPLLSITLKEVSDKIKEIFSSISITIHEDEIFTKGDDSIKMFSLLEERIEFPKEELAFIKEFIKVKDWITVTPCEQFRDEFDLAFINGILSE